MKHKGGLLKPSFNRNTIDRGLKNKSDRLNYQDIQSASSITTPKNTPDSININKRELSFPFSESSPSKSNNYQPRPQPRPQSPQLRPQSPRPQSPQFRPQSPRPQSQPQPQPLQINKKKQSTTDAIAGTVKTAFSAMRNVFGVGSSQSGGYTYSRRRPINKSKRRKRRTYKRKGKGKK